MNENAGLKRLGFDSTRIYNYKSSVRSLARYIKIYLSLPE